MFLSVRFFPRQLGDFVCFFSSSFFFFIAVIFCFRELGDFVVVVVVVLAVRFFSERVRKNRRCG